MEINDKNRQRRIRKKRKGSRKEKRVVQLCCTPNNRWVCDAEQVPVPSEARVGKKKKGRAALKITKARQNHHTVDTDRHSKVLQDASPWSGREK